MYTHQIYLPKRISLNGSVEKLPTVTSTIKSLKKPFKRQDMAVCRLTNITNEIKMKGIKIRCCRSL